MNLLSGADGDRPRHLPTHIPYQYVTTQERLGRCRAQPCSLAVSRLTVYTVKDLNGGASLSFLRKELRPVR